MTCALRCPRRDHDSLRIVEAQAEENNIKLTVVEHENVRNIMGDPELLRSVFNNLFINAVQSMGNEGGHLNVKISADEDVQFVRFAIADTGNGIPAENLLKIFERILDKGDRHGSGTSDRTKDYRPARRNDQC